MENEFEGVTRHPDVTLIAEADMEGDGSLDPRTSTATIEIVSRSNPDNDWVSKVRDYPLLGSADTFLDFGVREDGSGAAGALTYPAAIRPPHQT